MPYVEISEENRIRTFGKTARIFKTADE